MGGVTYGLVSPPPAYPCNPWLASPVVTIHIYASDGMTQLSITAFGAGRVAFVVIDTNRQAFTLKVVLLI